MDKVPGPKKHNHQLHVHRKIPTLTPGEDPPSSPVTKIGGQQRATAVLKTT
jgi:hypothetical protein